MGKSVPKGIKSKANVLLQELPASFDDTFATNKKSIVELKLPFSKWTTNVMSGFITRHHKKIKAAERKKEEAKSKREAASKAPSDMGTGISTPHARKEEKKE